MKNMKWITGVSLALVLMTAVFVGCKKDPDQLTLTALTANGVDLNSASSATGVAADANIIATFSSALDASTVNTTNIVLSLDGVSLPITLTTSGSTVTIDPTDNFGSGTLYKISFGSGLKSSDGGSFTAVERTFTTAGTYAPADVAAYWNFDDGTSNATIGGLTPSEATDVTYPDSHNSISGKAASFNGTTSYVEFANAGPGLMDGPGFSLSFWVYGNSINHVDGSGNTKGNFVMGTGAFRGFQFEIPGDYNSCKLAAHYDLDTTAGSEDIWFPADGNLGWQGWTVCKDLTASGGLPAVLKDKWAHIVVEYDHDSKVGSMYINGELMKQQDFNLWPVGDPKTGCIGLIFDQTATDVGKGFVFGFCYDKSSTLFSDPWGQASNPDGNHFQGMLDDVRIYHRALTANEITLMYNSSK